MRLGLGDLPLKRRLSWLEWLRRHLRESLFSNIRAAQYEEYLEEVASESAASLFFCAITALQSLELVPALISIVRVLVDVLPKVSVAT